MAILVRAGYQTRAFEECFINRAIPYKVIGGLRFYERQEIRDAIAYLRVTAQPDDDLAFERIVNVPKRGIGDSTIEQIRVKARSENISMVQATRKMIDADELKARVKTSLSKLLYDFDAWHSLLKTSDHREVTERIINESGYMQMWKSEKTIEAEGRVENLREFLNALEDFTDIYEFLEHVSLVSDSDNITDNNMVNVMTMHSAKGLEFDTVFLPGWEEGLFPSQKSIDESGTAGLEEERRLAYVGITRAKKNLYISFASSRRIYNQWQSSIPSRFIDELPAEFTDNINGGISYKPYNQNNKGLSKGSSGYVKSWDATSGRGNSSLAEYAKSYVHAGSTSHTPSSTKGFNKGNRIFHIKFGYGFITGVEGSNLTIKFDKTGIKTILDNFVEKA